MRKWLAAFEVDHSIPSVYTSFIVNRINLKIEYKFASIRKLFRVKIDDLIRLKCTILSAKYTILENSRYKITYKNMYIDVGVYRRCHPKIRNPCQIWQLRFEKFIRAL